MGAYQSTVVSIWQGRKAAHAAPSAGVTHTEAEEAEEMEAAATRISTVYRGKQARAEHRQHVSARSGSLKAKSAPSCSAPNGGSAPEAGEMAAPEAGEMAAKGMRKADSWNDWRWRPKRRAVSGGGVQTEAEAEEAEEMEAAATRISTVYRGKQARAEHKQRVSTRGATANAKPVALSTTPTAARGLAKHTSPIAKPAAKPTAKPATKPAAKPAASRKNLRSGAPETHAPSAATAAPAATSTTDGRNARRKHGGGTPQAANTREGGGVAPSAAPPSQGRGGTRSNKQGSRGSKQTSQGSTCTAGKAAYSGATSEAAIHSAAKAYETNKASRDAGTASPVEATASRSSRHSDRSSSPVASQVGDSMSDERSRGSSATRDPHASDHEGSRAADLGGATVAIEAGEKSQYEWHEADDAVKRADDDVVIARESDVASVPAAELVADDRSTEEELPNVMQSAGSPEASTSDEPVAAITDEPVAAMKDPQPTVTMFTPSPAPAGSELPSWLLKPLPAPAGSELPSWLLKPSLAPAGSELPSWLLEEAPPSVAAQSSEWPPPLLAPVGAPVTDGGSSGVRGDAHRRSDTQPSPPPSYKQQHTRALHPRLHEQQTPLQEEQQQQRQQERQQQQVWQQQQQQAVPPSPQQQQVCSSANAREGRRHHIANSGNGISGGMGGGVYSDSSLQQVGSGRVDDGDSRLLVGSSDAPRNDMEDQMPTASWAAASIAAPQSTALSSDHTGSVEPSLLSAHSSGEPEGHSSTEDYECRADLRPSHESSTITMVDEAMGRAPPQLDAPGSVAQQREVGSTWVQREAAPSVLNTHLDNEQQLISRDQQPERRVDLPASGQRAPLQPQLSRGHLPRGDDKLWRSTQELGSKDDHEKIQEVPPMVGAGRAEQEQQHVDGGDEDGFESHSCCNSLISAPTHAAPMWTQLGMSDVALEEGELDMAQVAACTPRGPSSLYDPAVAQHPTPAVQPAQHSALGSADDVAEGENIGAETTSVAAADTVSSPIGSALVSRASTSAIAFQGRLAPGNLRQFRQTAGGFARLEEESNEAEQKPSQPAKKPQANVGPPSVSSDRISKYNALRYYDTQTVDHTGGAQAESKSVVESEAKLDAVTEGMAEVTAETKAEVKAEATITHANATDACTQTEAIESSAATNQAAESASEADTADVAPHVQVETALSAPPWWTMCLGPQQLQKAEQQPQKVQRQQRAAHNRTRTDNAPTSSADEPTPEPQPTEANEEVARSLLLQEELESLRKQLEASKRETAFAHAEAAQARASPFDSLLLRRSQADTAKELAEAKRRLQVAATELERTRQAAIDDLAAAGREAAARLAVTEERRDAEVAAKQADAAEMRQKLMLSEEVVARLQSEREAADAAWRERERQIHLSHAQVQRAAQESAATEVSRLLADQDDALVRLQKTHAATEAAWRERESQLELLLADAEDSANAARAMAAAEKKAAADSKAAADAKAAAADAKAVAVDVRAEARAKAATVAAEKVAAGRVAAAEARSKAAIVAAEKAAADKLAGAGVQAGALQAEREAAATTLAEAQKAAAAAEAALKEERLKSGAAASAAAAADSVAAATQQARDNATAAVRESKREAESLQSLLDAIDVTVSAALAKSTEGVAEGTASPSGGDTTSGQRAHGISRADSFSRSPNGMRRGWAWAEQQDAHDTRAVAKAVTSALTAMDAPASSQGHVHGLSTLARHSPGSHAHSTLSATSMLSPTTTAPRGALHRHSGSALARTAAPRAGRALMARVDELCTRFDAALGAQLDAQDSKTSQLEEAFVAVAHLETAIAPVHKARALKGQRDDANEPMHLALGSAESSTPRADKERGLTSGIHAAGAHMNTSHPAAHDGDAYLDRVRKILQSHESSSKLSPSSPALRLRTTVSYSPHV